MSFKIFRIYKLIEEIASQLRLVRHNLIDMQNSNSKEFEVLQAEIRLIRIAINGLKLEKKYLSESEV